MGHAVSGQWSQTAEVIVGCGGAVMWASTAWPIILVVLEFSRAEGVEPAATDFSLHLSVMWLPTEMSKTKKENGIKKKIHQVCPYKESFRYTSIWRKNKYL